MIAHPKPLRRRGRLPSVTELGGKCQVCGGTVDVQRAHLLRGPWREADPDLVMLLCGPFGRCNAHARLDAYEPAAAREVRAAMTEAQAAAVAHRRGQGYLDERYPREAA